MKHHLLALTLSALLLLSTFALAAPDHLVNADWLSEHIEDDALIVLEVRYHPMTKPLHSEPDNLGR